MREEHAEGTLVVRGEAEGTGRGTAGPHELYSSDLDRYLWTLDPAGKSRYGQLLFRPWSFLSKDPE